MIALPRRQFLRVGLGLGVAVGSLSTACAGAGVARAAGADALVWRERLFVGFGTRVWLRAAHADAARVDLALDDAVGAVRQVEAQMSLYDPASALSVLNREGVLHRPDPHLRRVLALAGEVSRRSGGTFDVTMQPLWIAWSQAHREGRLPSGAELRRACALVGWQGVEGVEGGDASIRLARTGMAVSLNGVAQGYAADVARARLRAHGIAHALLDTGEWSPLGHGPGGADWTLGLENPRGWMDAPPLARLVSDGRAMATSSDVHTAFSADLRHHHIIDPRSGYSPTAWASVTVLAPSCALADALTKVLFMAPAQHALELARQWRVDAVLVAKSGRLLASPGVLKPQSPSSVPF